MHSAYSVLNHYFDHIYVLTLRRATDRQEAYRQHLRGLNYEVVYGQDKQDFSYDSLTQTGTYDADRLRAVNRYQNGRPLSLGMIGCAWSHRLLYEDLLAKGYERVLIFEDDAVPVEAALPQLQAALSELPPDWELLYLGYLTNERPAPPLKRGYYQLLFRFWRGHVFRWTPAEVNRIYPRPYSPHLRRAGYHDCTHAYALTARAARTLIPEQTPVTFAPDSLLADAIVSGRIRQAFVTNPKFFDQADFATGHDGTGSYINF